MQTQTSAETKIVGLTKTKSFFTVNTSKGKKIIKNLLSCSGRSYSVLPCLNWCLIEIDSLGVKMSTTNLESVLISSIPAVNFEGDIKTCVNINYLSWFFNRAFEKEVTIEFENEICFLKCGDYSIQVSCEEVVNYPKYPDLEPKRNYFFDKNVFNEISCAKGFTSNDDLRPAMTGVYLHSHDGKMRVAATDAHRLYFKTVNVEVDEVFECIIPKKSLQVISSVFSSGFFKKDAVHFGIKNEQYTFISKMIDARYPNYKAVIPAETVSFTVNKKQITQLLNLCEQFTNKSTNMVTFGFEENFLSVESGDEDFSVQAKNKIPVENKFSLFFKFGMNVTFLLQALENCSCDLVEIKTNGNPDSCFIIEDKILLMPLHINQ